MPQKYVVALANALASQRPGEHWDANKRIQWNLDVRAIASVVKVDGFFLACGGLFDV